MARAGRLAADTGMRVVARNVNKYGRAMGLEALRRLIHKTPVDEGIARGNWFTNVGSAADEQTDVVRLPGVVLADGRVVIADWAMMEADLHLTNNVPYIERLENGYSRQAPQGMARLTVKELQPLSDQIALRVRRGG